MPSSDLAHQLVPYLLFVVFEDKEFLTCLIQTMKHCTWDHYSQSRCCSFLLLWCFSCGSCCCENCINQALSVSETNFKVLPQWFGRCLVETPGIECVVTCDPFLHCNYGTEWIWCTGKLTRASHKPWGGSHEPNIIIEKSNFASRAAACDTQGQ